jgi:hypothetical protein
VIDLSKRIAVLAVAAAATLSFGLGGTPAGASDCISLFTTPVQCVEESVNHVVASCLQGTQVTCLPSS